MQWLACPLLIFAHARCSDRGLGPEQSRQNEHRDHAGVVAEDHPAEVDVVEEQKEAADADADECRPGDDVEDKPALDHLYPHVAILTPR